MTLRFIVTCTDCQDDYNVCDVSPSDVVLWSQAEIARMSTTLFFYGHRH